MKNKIIYPYHSLGVFNVGDRVIGIDNEDGSAILSCTGTVLSLTKEYSFVIRFDDDGTEREQNRIEYAKIRKQNGETPRRWNHGTTGWKYSKDCECWYKADWNQPPKEYCLGDRYIHCDYGLDSYGIRWRGSASDHWHGWSFGYDLKQAIEWLHSTPYPEYGPELWSGPNGEEE